MPKFRTLVLFAAVALSAAACTTTGQQSGAGTQPAQVDMVKACQVTQAIYDGSKPLLDAKCAADVAAGKDPLKDGFCLGSAGGAVAVQACFAAANQGNAATVNAAKASVQQAATDVAKPPAP